MVMVKNDTKIKNLHKEKESRLTLRDDFFYGVDSNAKITFISADVEQLTNLNKKELIGKPVSSILYCTNNDKEISFSINNLINTSLKDGKTRTSENEIFYRSCLCSSNLELLFSARTGHLPYACLLSLESK